MVVVARSESILGRKLRGDDRGHHGGGEDLGSGSDASTTFGGGGGTERIRQQAGLASRVLCADDLAPASVKSSAEDHGLQSHAVSTSAPPLERRDSRCVDLGICSVEGECEEENPTRVGDVFVMEKRSDRVAGRGEMASLYLTPVKSICDTRVLTFGQVSSQKRLAIVDRGVTIADHTA